MYIIQEQKQIQNGVQCKHYLVQQIVVSTRLMWAAMLRVGSAIRGPITLPATGTMMALRVWIAMSLLMALSDALSSSRPRFI